MHFITFKSKSKLLLLYFIKYKMYSEYERPKRKLYNAFKSNLIICLIELNYGTFYDFDLTRVTLYVQCT